jgi:hypothetical protein
MLHEIFFGHPYIRTATIRGQRTYHIRTLLQEVSTDVNIITIIYCNGPLPLNGQLVTDVISAATDTDSCPITRNGWAKRNRGNRYAL